MRIFLVALAILLLSTAYYADVEVYITRDGLVTIEGDTDYPKLLVRDSSDLTSKEGRYWLLNITFMQTFERYSYSIHLPKGSTINYMKMPSIARIDESGGLTVSGTGDKLPFLILVQYQLRPMTEHWYMFSLMLIPIIIYIGIRRAKAKPRIDMSSLTDRQKQIVRLLQKSKGMTQAALEQKTGLPKSSLSRNIDSLVRRGIITRVEKGMSNYISLQDVPPNSAKK
jgi:uncharacterized membrane protein